MPHEVAEAIKACADYLVSTESDDYRKQEHDGEHIFEDAIVVYNWAFNDCLDTKDYL